MRPTERTMPVCVGHGVAPPIKPVLPACGTIAIPLSKQSFTTLDVSSTVAGRTTTAAVPMVEPRQSVTNGCLPWSSRIRPLSPTMARSPSRTVGVTAAVGMLGVMTLSGMVSSFIARSLASLAGRVTSGCAAQAVVDRKAQARFGDRHDRDAADARPVERSHLGEEVGRRLGEIAGGAEIVGQHGARMGSLAERQKAFVASDAGCLQPDRPGGSVVAFELAGRTAGRVA